VLHFKRADVETNEVDPHSDPSVLGRRVSGLFAGGAVAVLGLLVGLSVAFATGTQTEQYALDADVVQRSDEVLTASSVLRADLGVVLVLARSDAAGLEVTDLAEATAQLVTVGSIMDDRVASWEPLLPQPTPGAGAASRSVRTSIEDVVAAVDRGDPDGAERQAVGTVLPALDRLNDSITAERDAAAARLQALRSTAGTVARLASLGVALIVPGVAFFIFRMAMRRRERQAQLELALKQERELVKTKDEFVANLSHELRTPLTGIFGFAMVLDDMLDLGPEYLDFEMISDTTDVILSEAGELNRMVEDLLTAARKEGGSLKLVLEELDIRTAVESSIDLFRRQGHEVTVDFEPAVLTIGRHHLNQLVRNLVSNAAKHGGPNIAIEGRVVPGGYRVRVMDDGEGVPGELVERLFSRFVHQGETPLTTGSVGLGLFIASMLAETMGGKLSYERVDDVTVFEFTLPVEHAVMADSAEEAA
jgi:signal transduction histidine kinase